MIGGKDLRRAFAYAALFGGAVIAPSDEAIAQDGGQKPAATAAELEKKAETAPSADPERAALRRLAMRYVGLKDLKGARKNAAQKAYDLDKENFLKSFDPTYARDKSAYQSAAEEYETKRRAVWQSALDELKAEGYEFNGAKLDGEDLQYRKRPVEEDAAGSSASARGEPDGGFLGIVSKYVQSNADIQTLGARRLQAYKALAAHQDALIEKIDAEVPAASQEAAQPAPAKTAPLEAPKPAEKEPAQPLAEAPAKPTGAVKQPGAMESTQPLLETPAKPPAEASAKPPTQEPAKAPPRPPELRMSQEPAPPAPPTQSQAAARAEAQLAPVVPRAETPARPEAPREAIGKPGPSREARGLGSASAVALPTLPPLPRLPAESGSVSLPEAPELPEDGDATTPAAAPLAAAPHEFLQLRAGVFGSVNWARPNLSWSSGVGSGAFGPWGVSPSLDHSFGGGGAQIALRLRPFDAGFLVGLALDAAGRGGGAHSGLSPLASTSFSSRFEATQRVEVGFDIDLWGTTVVTPFATAGFSEAQIAFSRYGGALGAFAWGSASGFRFGATYGGGLELKMGGPALQLLYLRHEYNPVATAIWGGAVGGAFFGARTGLVENELRVGLVVPLPRPW